MNLNRLWIRLSLSYTLVLIIVLSMPILLFWSAFLHGGGRGRFEGQEMWMAPRFGFVSLFYLVLISLFSLLIGIVAGAIVSRQLGKQVTRLVDATNEITPDNLQHRVAVQGVEELQELAISFNRMVAELDQSQQTRRNLLADVSHELLTPLTVLEGNLRAMLDGVYEISGEEVSHLYDQTHHMIGLVKELRQLTLAEAQQLKLDIQLTDLNDVVEETVALFEPLTSEKEISLRQVAFLDLPQLKIDRMRIRQVLSNLLSNALRHTPEGGTITILTRMQDGVAQLQVQDTGEGLGDAEAAQIFERFYRTDGSVRRDAGGAGLGLAIVKALVEAHGGSVAAGSHNSEGATVTVSLPFTAE